MTRYPPLLAAAMSLAACQASLPPAPAAAATTLTYTCGSRIVQASYPDTDTAVLVFDQKTHRLHVAISASGARYVGDGWQWWTKGMQQAFLAPLASGETYASAPGVECRAP